MSKQVKLSILLEYNETFEYNSDSELGIVDSMIQSIDCIDGLEVVDYMEEE